MMTEAAMGRREGVSGSNVAQGGDSFVPGQPLLVPGGALDPACRPRDVYLETPTEAASGTSPAAKIARNYIRLVNERRYDAISSLFADDGLSLPPSRQVVQGRAALDAFYPEIAQVGPKLIAVGYTSTDSDCFVEIAAEEEVDGERRYVLVAVNHFTVNRQGLATRMITYARPRQPVFELKSD
jgi:hypothetical protein